MIEEINGSDYVLISSGRLGSKTSVSSEDYGFIGEYNSEDEAIEAIKEHMELSKIWSNVWCVSDHGNIEAVKII